MKDISTFKIAYIQKSMAEMDRVARKIMETAKQKESLQEQLTYLLDTLLYDKEKGNGEEVDDIIGMDSILSSLKEIAPTATADDLGSLRISLQYGLLSEGAISAKLKSIYEDIERTLNRSKTSSLFSMLLSDWVKAGGDQSTHESCSEWEAVDENDPRYANSLLECKESLSPHPLDGEDFSSIFNSLSGTPFVREEAFSSCEEAWEEQLKILMQRFRDYEVQEAIRSICSANLISPAKQEQLRAIIHQPRIINEYVGVFNIMLTTLDDWDWSAPVPIRMATNRNGKIRLFLEEDELTCLFLELLGARIGVAFENSVTFAFERCQLIPGCYEASLLKNRHEKRSSQLYSGLPSSMDSFRETNAYSIDSKYTQLSRTNVELNLQRYFHCENDKAEEALKEILEKNALEIAENRFGGVIFDSLKKVVVEEVDDDGEVTLKPSVFTRSTEKYVAVSALDIKSCYPSFSHSLIKEILEYYYFPQELIDLVMKIISTPVILPDGTLGRIQRGIPIAHAISKVICEAVFSLIDMEIFFYLPLDIPSHLPTANYRYTGYQRIVDDFYLVDTPSQVNFTVGLMKEKLAKMGFALNAEKCGTVLVPRIHHIYNQGEVDDILSNSPHLYQGSVTWGLLELTCEGSWIVSPTLFEQSNAGFLEKFYRGKSIIDKVSIYNDHVSYVCHRIGSISPALGPVHENSVMESLAHLHAGICFTFSGQQVKGITAALIHCMVAQYGANSVPDLCDAWFFWPLSGGGLNLTYAMYPVTGYERPSTLPPSTYDFSKVPYTSNPLSEYAKVYRYLHTHLLPGSTPPTYSPTMKGLIESFIDRGNKMLGRSGGAEPITQLSPKWEWILCTFSFEILAHFGTTSFFDPDLVPLTLLSDARKAGRL